MNKFLTFGLAVMIHPIADFSLQSTKIASKKRGLNREMLIHIGCHQLALLGLFIVHFQISVKLLVAIGYYLVSHWLIDNLKVWFGLRLKTTTIKDKYFWPLLGLDQALHMAALFFLFAW